MSWWADTLWTLAVGTIAFLAAYRMSSDSWPWQPRRPRRPGYLAPPPGHIAGCLGGHRGDCEVSGLAGLASYTVYLKFNLHELSALIATITGARDTIARQAGEEYAVAMTALRERLIAADTELRTRAGLPVD